MNKRKISISSKGRRADIGSMSISRILPNRYTQAVGPFVFLDHILPTEHAPEEKPSEVNGTGAHPHRGIATLTYVLNGEAVHLDSRGHKARVRSGGVQWMKAGNGIVHDEAVNVDSGAGNRLTHGFQFWINLPAKNKKEAPGYLALQAEEVPLKQLDGGWLKVIAGDYQGLASGIPAYSAQFIYHIHLEAGKSLALSTSKDLEYAAFLPLNGARINDTDHEQGEFIGFETEEGSITIQNTSAAPTDIILFGGEHYTEPIVAQGPFVMNTEHEISQAYNDFYAGKYGEINYN